jgi:hypothetical protein
MTIDNIQSQTNINTIYKKELLLESEIKNIKRKSENYDILIKQHYMIYLFQQYSTILLM